MPNYISPDAFPMLEMLTAGWPTMKREIEAFEDNLHQYGPFFGITKHPNPESKIAGNPGWNNIPFYIQGMRGTDFLKKHQVTPLATNPTPEEVDAFCASYNGYVNKLFPASYALADAFFAKHGADVSNIVIFRLATGSLIPVHTNYDPFMYRAHMGIVVPPGEIGMLVEGEQTCWEEGKFFIFDSMRAHTVWNYTGLSRYVLSVDCYRPEIQRAETAAAHQALLDLRMREAKRSLGFSGGRSELLPGNKERFQSRYEAEGRTPLAAGAAMNA